MKRICTGTFVVNWVAEQTNEYGNFGCATGIGVQEWHGATKCWRLIAGVAYADFNGPNVVCHIASDGSKRWMSREYLATIFDYPFNQMKVKRITVCVGEGNGASRRFVEKLGFTRETTLSQAHPTGDLLVYRMFREECRWISADFYKPLAKAA